MKNHVFYEGIWDFWELDKDGLVLSHEVVHNDLVNEGQSTILDSFFRGQNTPTEFYFRLANDSIDKTDTLSSIVGEPSGNGYSAKLLEKSIVGFPNLDLDSGDYRTMSKYVTWTASGGDIGPVLSAYLATTSNNTGKLIATLSFNSSKTISSGNSLVSRVRIKLK